MKCYLRHESALKRRIRLAVPKRHCTWCLKPVGPGRRSWCSQACVDAFRAINDPGVIRRRVFERDQGICAQCGHDTKQSWLTEMAKSLQSHAQHFRVCYIWWKKQKRGPFGTVRRGLRCPCVFCRAQRLCSDLKEWEADHIAPVAEGGGQCGLDGYRTLCLVCHKRATRKLRARLRKPA